MLKPAVVEAISQIEARFGADNVQHLEDGSGGAYVVVDGLDLGTTYTNSTRVSWMGFRIGFQYPMADIYPHFVRPDLARVDGRAFGSGVSGPTRFVGYERDALQLSRRSNRRDAGVETALIKMLKVLDWIRSGP
ncbi:MAG TPA: hypothetical protein VJN96_02330 [Vicinamibacterales bacterium]|nr:hypothetical protein [Vicinamibacterales bacterium]